jgi:hypothetical protein
VLPLDYIHALCLGGIALYVWQREPPRLLLTPLMLLSFFVLYGAGNIIYFVGAEDIDPDVRKTVTLCLILMWFGLVGGIELAGLTLPKWKAVARQSLRTWRSIQVVDDRRGNQLLAVLGILMALVIWGVFIYTGKLGQIHTFFSLDLSSSEKRDFRAEFAGGGDYFYQLLVASVAPFLSFLLLVKGLAGKDRYLLPIGLLMCGAALAGKVGTFQKVPWLVYLLQLMVVFQARRRLEFGMARAIVFSVVLLAGAAAAALIAIPDLDSAMIFEWLGYRFLEVNNEVVYQTMYVYPRFLPHTWGMNIGILHALFGSGDLLSAHSRVATFFGADGATFDSFFIGDAWVDFSYGGVILMSIIVGYVVKSIDLFVLSLGKRPLAIALIGSNMYGLFELQVTSAFTAFLTGGLLLIPLLVAAFAGLFNDFSDPSADARSPAAKPPRAT